MTFGVVYNDVWMLERELVQLVVPIRVVEFVDELEGHVGEGLGGFDTDEIDAALVGKSL